MRCKIGCTVDLMNNGSDLQIGESMSNSNRVFYIHLSVNTLRKGMDPCFILPAIG